MPIIKWWTTVNKFLHRELEIQVRKRSNMDHNSKCKKIHKRWTRMVVGMTINRWEETVLHHSQCQVCHCRDIEKIVFRPKCLEFHNKTSKICKIRPAKMLHNWLIPLWTMISLWHQKTSYKAKSTCKINKLWIKWEWMLTKAQSTKTQCTWTGAQSTNQPLVQPLREPTTLPKPVSPSIQQPCRDRATKISRISSQASKKI